MTYGMTENGAHCVNSEPGTFNHECQKPAAWIGTKVGGFKACFCADCKTRGWDAKNVKHWHTIN